MNMQMTGGRYFQMMTPGKPEDDPDFWRWVKEMQAKGAFAQIANPMSDPNVYRQYQREWSRGAQANELAPMQRYITLMRQAGMEPDQRVIAQFIQQTAMPDSKIGAVGPMPTSSQVKATRLQNKAAAAQNELAEKNARLQLNATETLEQQKARLARERVEMQKQEQASRQAKREKDIILGEAKEGRLANAERRKAWKERLEIMHGKQLAAELDSMVASLPADDRMLVTGSVLNLSDKVSVQTIKSIIESIADSGRWNAQLKVYDTAVKNYQKDKAAARKDVDKINAMIMRLRQGATANNAAIEYMTKNAPNDPDLEKVLYNRKMDVGRYDTLIAQLQALLAGAENQYNQIVPPEQPTRSQQTGTQQTLRNGRVVTVYRQ